MMRVRVAPDEPMLGPYRKTIKRVLWLAGAVFMIGLAINYLVPMYIHYYVPEELTPHTATTPQRDDDTLNILLLETVGQNSTPTCKDTPFLIKLQNIISVSLLRVPLGKKIQPVRIFT